MKKSQYCMSLPRGLSRPRFIERSRDCSGRRGLVDRYRSIHVAVGKRAAHHWKAHNLEPGEVVVAPVRRVEVGGDQGDVSVARNALQVLRHVPRDNGTRVRPNAIAQRLLLLGEGASDWCQCISSCH